METGNEVAKANSMLGWCPGPDQVAIAFNEGTGLVRSDGTWLELTRRGEHITHDYGPFNSRLLLAYSMGEFRRGRLDLYDPDSGEFTPLYVPR